MQKYPFYVYNDIQYGKKLKYYLVIGIHLISAAIGVVCFQWLPSWGIAASATVGLAIGIMYYTPESAAKKVNEISQDPLAWWHQPEIQDAKLHRKIWL